MLGFFYKMSEPAISIEFFLHLSVGVTDTRPCPATKFPPQSSIRFFTAPLSKAYGQLPCAIATSTPKRLEGDNRRQSIFQKGET